MLHVRLIKRGQKPDRFGVKPDIRDGNRNGIERSDSVRGFDYFEFWLRFSVINNSNLKTDNGAFRKVVT